MKYLILVFISVFVSKACFAQNDPAPQKFIRAVVTENRVIYTDSLDTYTVNKVIKVFNQRDKYLNVDSGFVRSDIPKSKIIFTKKELVYINQELKKLRRNAWCAGLILNGTIVPTDTINKIFSKGSARGWPYFHQHFGRSVYSFSKPIFVRDNTICIFYMGYSCDGTCGEGNLSIYINTKDGGWKPVCLLYSWIS